MMNNITSSFLLLSQLMNKAMLLPLFLFLGCDSLLFSQTVWTGNFSTNWNDHNNWSTDNVPNATNEVVIANVVNKPTITTAAVAKTVTVNASAILTITNTGTLTINGSSSQGILNNGTVNNSGTITIGNTASVGSHGIMNQGTFNNLAGTINIYRSTDVGLWNYSGTFTNTATINIDGSAIKRNWGLQNGSGFFDINGATFNNNTGGHITIDGSTYYGGLYNNYSIFNNAETITIGATLSIGPTGLQNEGSTFNNNTGGQIIIDRTNPQITDLRETEIALYNHYGTFNNNATITVGGTAHGGEYGIQSDYIFYNNVGGQINIDNSTVIGLWSLFTSSPYIIPTFGNQGTITIGGTASVGTGLKNEGNFNNTNGGIINIDRSTGNGLWNNLNVFTNTATINIGASASVDGNGIYNHSNYPGIIPSNPEYPVFNNNVGGQININHTGGSGIYNPFYRFFFNRGTIKIGQIASVGYGLNGGLINTVSGLFNIDNSRDAGINSYSLDNFGIVNIGQIASVGNYGIKSDFSNEAGGIINIDRSTEAGISSDGFRNLGTITIGHIASVGNYGIITSGIFSNYASGQINIDRSTLIGLYMSSNSGSLSNNDGIINIGGTASVGNIGLQNEGNGVLHNNIGGQINIDRSTLIGLYNTYIDQFRRGVVNNDGLITIGAKASVGNIGCQNSGVVSNNTGGQINIDRSTLKGFYNTYASYSHLGIVNNSGAITIGAMASVGNYGLHNESTFNNNTGGQITIDNSTVIGLYNLYDPTLYDATILPTGNGYVSIFNNQAGINIGSSSTMGFYGLQNESTFNNNTGGTIAIDRSTDTGLWNKSGTFTNSATLNIGSSYSVGLNGIYNQTLFNNAAGQLKIDNTVNGAIINFASTFTNAATITMGSIASVGTVGIFSQATFNNNTGGIIKIDRASTSGVYNQSGTFTNAATVTVGKLVSMTNLMLAVAGTFSNSMGGTFNGTGNLSAAYFTHAGGTLSPGYSPGKMTFDANTNFSNSTMAIEINGTGIAGTNFDQIVVTGTATLGGNLTLTVGYTPVTGDHVTILTTTALSGIFATVTGLPSGWAIGYSATAVILTFTAVLPLELLDFKATPSVSGNLLTWTTANEVNNKGFQVERLMVNGEWLILDFVNAKGKAATYDFMDNTPLSTSYYRLRQMDNDGKETLSKIISVERKDNSKLKVYPNPVTDLLTIETTETGDVQIINLLGQQVLTGIKPPLGVGGIDVSALPQGAYFLKVGAEQVKFVRQ